ncbi:MAG: hypothetical protein M3447_00665, partial [Acidobacteriota bacterium]|nr:hypothetical protein [Acidobacteriota bacterium]
MGQRFDAKKLFLVPKILKLTGGEAEGPLKVDSVFIFQEVVRMPLMFSRRLLGLVLSLILPAAVLAQSRPQTMPPAPTPGTETKPAAENEKAASSDKAEKQTPAPAETAKSKQAKGKFTLKVASGPVRAVDLRA